MLVAAVRPDVEHRAITGAGAHQHPLLDQRRRREGRERGGHVGLRLDGAEQEQSDQCGEGPPVDLGPFGGPQRRPPRPDGQRRTGLLAEKVGDARVGVVPLPQDLSQCVHDGLITKRK